MLNGVINAQRSIINGMNVLHYSITTEVFFSSYLDHEATQQSALICGITIDVVTQW